MPDIGGVNVKLFPKEINDLEPYNLKLVFDTFSTKYVPVPNPTRGASSGE